MRALVLLCINQYTKFEVPSFTNYKDMIGQKLRVKWFDYHMMRYGIFSTR